VRRPLNAPAVRPQILSVNADSGKRRSAPATGTIMSNAHLNTGAPGTGSGSGLAISRIFFDGITAPLAG